MMGKLKINKKTLTPTRDLHDNNSRTACQGMNEARE